MSNKDLITASLQKAQDELEDVVNNVAQLAQEVADQATLIPEGRHHNYYKVPAVEMDELKTVLKVWKEKTQNFLSEVAKAGG